MLGYESVSLPEGNCPPQLKRSIVARKAIAVSSVVLGYADNACSPSKPSRGAFLPVAFSCRSD